MINIEVYEENKSIENQEEEIIIVLQPYIDAVLRLND